MTVVTTDGDTTWAFRYSSEGRSRSLFHSTDVSTLRDQYPDNPILHELSDGRPPRSSPSRWATCTARGARCRNPPASSCTAVVRSCARSFRPSRRWRPDRVPAHHRGGPVAGQQVVATSSAKLRHVVRQRPDRRLTVFRVAADGAASAAPAAVCTASKLACRSSTWVAYSEVASSTTSCSADLHRGDGVLEGCRAVLDHLHVPEVGNRGLERLGRGTHRGWGGLSADELVPSEEQPRSPLRPPRPAAMRRIAS